MTSPVDREKLKSFYRKVHPGGIGWKSIAKELPDVKSDTGFGLVFVNWLFGVALVYASLFGIGHFIFQDYTEALIYLVVGVISVAVIYRNLSKQSFE